MSDVTDGLAPSPADQLTTPFWKAAAEGQLKLPKCEACGLDYSFADPADGPAFFVMMFVCIPAVAFPLWLELTYSPPTWVHLVTTLPLILLTCIPPLQPLKGWLVASQYVHKAEEGRLASPAAGSGPSGG